MVISSKTLQELCVLINEKTEYRKGSELVSFFNDLGFDDTYEHGFPSRGSYTYSKLELINGKPELDKCIKQLFSPINFIGRIEDLAKLVNEFNEYLAFDGWKVEVKNKGVEIHRCSEPDIENQIKQVKLNQDAITEDEFIKREISINPSSLPVFEQLKPVIASRIEEITHCFSAKAFLSCIILSGSVLEAILLGVASNHLKEFNCSVRAPRDKQNQVRKLNDWSLANFIEVANDLGILKEDVKKFSHALRDFRNYIHPFQQLQSEFYPDEHTAKICFQVMKAALAQISNYYS